MADSPYYSPPPQYSQATGSQFVGSPTQYTPSHADFDFVSTSDPGAGKNI